MNESICAASTSTPLMMPMARPAAQTRPTAIGQRSPASTCKPMERM